MGYTLGISIIDFENDVSTDYELPQGHDLHDMIVLQNHVVMVTEAGVWIAAYSEGEIVPISQWEFYPGRYTAGAKLIADGGDDYVLALGYSGFGSVFQINEISVSQLSVGTGITNALNTGNATATSIAHVDATGGSLTA